MGVFKLSIIYVDINEAIDNLRYSINIEWVITIFLIEIINLQFYIVILKSILQLQYIGNKRGALEFHALSHYILPYNSFDFDRLS